MCVKVSRVKIIGAQKGDPTVLFIQVDPNPESPLLTYMLFKVL